MKHFPAIAVAVAAVILLLIWFIPSGNAQNGNSQEYHSGRFVIIAAPVNVLSPQMGGSSNTQEVIVKLDTVTGRSWILQLDVAGGNEPKVRSSSWHELGVRRQ